MYTVVLVDDETLDLEGLKRLVPWNDFNMKVIAAFDNSFDALEFINNQSVDILISDIKMPIMTGLELCHKVKQKRQNLKVVFISGHEDFQFAKKAIELNAAGYVLKPIVDEDLFGVLTLLKSQLEDERKLAVMQSEFKESISFMKAEFLHQLIEGRADDKTISGIRAHYALEDGAEKFCIAIVEVDELLAKPGLIARTNSVRDIGHSLKLIMEIIVNFGLGYPFKTELHQISILLLPSRFENLPLKLQDLIGHIKKELGLSITIGLGDTVPELNNISVSYTGAKDALFCKFFLGKGRVIPVQMASPQMSQASFDLEESLQQLLKGILNYEISAIDASLKELFFPVKDSKNIISVYNFVIYLIFKLDLHLQKIGENVDSLHSKDFKYLDTLLYLETIYDIKAWLREELVNIASQLNSRKKGKNSKLIREIEQFVCQNLGGKITISEIAENFAFSPNHLGVIFKDETGENFSDYLIRKRMERAHELLLNQKYKIYEVADMMGYKNLTYFSRQFREHFGLTPSDFRKQNQ